MAVIKITESQYEDIKKRALAGANYFPEIAGDMMEENPSTLFTEPEGELDERVTFNNPLSVMLSEGLIMSYPADKTINYVKKLFKIPDYGIRESNGAIIIGIIVPNKNNMTTLNKIIRAMQLCGYFLSRPKIDVLMMRSGKKTTLQFEPKYDHEVKDDMLKGEKELLHITLSKNVEKIKYIGLTPSSKNKMFNYPERIYLLKGSIPYEDIVNLAELLASVYNHNNKGEKRDYDYSVLHLDVDKLPDTIRLFPDSNYEPYGLYTIDNIPPSAITEIERLPLTVG